MSTLLEDERPLAAPLEPINWEEWDSQLDHGGNNNNGGGGRGRDDGRPERPEFNFNRIKFALLLGGSTLADTVLIKGGLDANPYMIGGGLAIAAAAGITLDVRNYTRYTIYNLFGDNKNE